MDGRNDISAGPAPRSDSGCLISRPAATSARSSAVICALGDRRRHPLRDCGNRMGRGRWSHGLGVTLDELSDHLEKPRSPASCD